MTVNEKDVIDIAVGETVIIRRWRYSEKTLNVVIEMGNEILMNISFNGRIDDMVDNKKNELILRYNDTSKYLSLVLCNPSRNDEGLYHIKESIYENSTDIFQRQEGEWRFQLNVFDHGEMKTGSVGENMTIIELQKSDMMFLVLNYYEEIVATSTLFDPKCVVSSQRHLYGRLKCTEDKIRNTYSIEIQNVTQMDTCSYRVYYNNKGSTKRCFINITGIIGTSTQGNFTQYTTSSDNPSNRSYGQLSSLHPALTYVIPVATGVGFFIIGMTGCLIWIQRKNSRRLESVQRLILEKCETASFPIPSTIRKHVLIHPTCDRRTGSLLTQPNALHNTGLGLPYAHLPSTSTAVHVACNSIYALSEQDDDNPGLNNIIQCSESSKISKYNLSAGYMERIDNDILDSSPSVLILMSAEDGVEQNYNCTSNECEKTPVLQSFQTLCAKVKKQSKPSSRNTDTGAIMSGDGYELVDLSCDIDIVKAFKVDEIIHVSTTNQNMSSHDFACGTCLSIELTTTMNMK
ncbi:hypothetical protein CHS0354_012798 [Potamilus streckersoni]|uniref:Uncharacterized protein n=1 Tax=Potamilus streckersoni TaxID=2493646 RepID=A0AAE0SWR6_9BIVA|nr:hypothetical protein CHS0354_012798 [Potamilus streckersoni]